MPVREYVMSVLVLVLMPVLKSVLKPVLDPMLNPVNISILTVLISTRSIYVLKTSVYPFLLRRFVIIIQIRI